MGEKIKGGKKEVWFSPAASKHGQTEIQEGDEEN